METPFTAGAFKPEEIYAASAERFFELLKGFSVPNVAAGVKPSDWSQFAAPLATQLEQWLRMSQSAGPWFSGPAGLGAGVGPGLGPAPSWSFGPLPLGPAAVLKPETRRVWELLTRLSELQTQLATHWSEVARSAAQRFVARAGAPLAAPSLEQTLKLYELWVACAEEAYAATARGDDFSRLQSEIANVSAALLVEQRRHAESLVRAFGLPTRNEVDALYAHIKDLNRRLAELGEGTRTAAPRAARRSKPKAKAGAKRATGKRGRRS